MSKNNKILIKNIYYMLTYAFRSLNQKAYENISLDEFDNLHNLFAGILSRGVNLQLKQGLYREYINKTEDLLSLRGKININETIKNRILHQNAISCEFDELSENNLYNQILKSTMLLLLKCKDVDKEYKQDMKKSLLFFSTVDEMNDLKQVRWSSIKIQRNNQNYRMLLGICQLIVEGMLLTTEEGQYRFSKFIDDQKMWHLYQNFILEYYKKHHPELKPSSPQIPWDLSEGESLGLLPAMQTDIVLHHNDKTLIIDAKYYTSGSLQSNYNKNTIISGNLYQIYTYVKNMDKDQTGNVSGMLLYAKTDEDIVPNETHMMSGNKIIVDTLDLNVEFDEIRKQLELIVVNLR